MQERDREVPIAKQLKVVGLLIVFYAKLIWTVKKVLKRKSKKIYFSPVLYFIVILMGFVVSHLAYSATNPYFNIDPVMIFPSKTALLPQGAIYNDTVPDTLDLAERAKWYIRGVAQENVPYQNIWIPGGPAFFNSAAPGSSECSSIPCIGKTEGYPNWGKLALGVILAREMTSYDQSDNDGTLGAEFRSISTMLAWDTWPILQSIGAGGGYNIVWGQKFTTPATVAMQSLVTRYRQDPNNQALKSAINEYVRMHKELLSAQTINGVTYYDFLDPSIDTVPDSQIDGLTGFQGKYWYFAFVNGRAALAMFDWYNLTGNQDAYDVGSKLTAFLRNFQPLWQNPDPSRFPNEGSGQFEGHIHAYLQAAHAYLAEAEARRKANPYDAIAQDDINRAQAMYEFVKRRTKGDVLGNFGEMDTVDDMIRLGINLTDLGAYPYFDEVERWTRNQLADGQIDPFTGQNYIPNYITSTYSTDHVGNKVTGFWFSDATHSLVVPPATQMFNLDDATNPMHAMYEVWDHIVQIKGNFAQINFDLNRASQYLDVKSDLPYRGQVVISMKSNIGPLQVIGVRVPNWADQSSVSVLKRDASGDHPLTSGTNWTWLAGTYVRIAAVQANVSYVVKFPIKISQQQFNDIRAFNQFWYEGSYGSPGYPESLIGYTGTFRGDTLVDAAPRPTGGIPRYQRGVLAQLPATDTTPPVVTVERFVMQPVSTPTPTTSPLSSPSPTPTADTTPPYISNVTIINVTQYTADINWTTNEPADGQIAFCTTYLVGCANNTPLVTQLTTQHTINLSGLTPNTYYYMWIKSRDAAGNLRTYYRSFRTTGTTTSPSPTPTVSPSPTPTTDYTAPYISSVTVTNLTQFSATVNWTTNEPADGQIAFCTTYLVGCANNTPLVSQLTTSHTINLSGLAPNTYYYMWIKSRDAAGNLRTYYRSFKTLAGTTTSPTPTPTSTVSPSPTSTTDYYPPIISSVTLTNVTQFAATVNWTTNEPADGQIAFCTTYLVGCANNTPLVTQLTTQHTINLSGLAPNTYYYMWIKSRDAAGNLRTYYRSFKTAL